MKFAFFILLGIAAINLGCGGNIYQSIDSADASEKAVVALENEDPDKAINILEKEIEKKDDNYQAISLLATAKAQKAGIDIIDITLNLVTSQSENVQTSANNPVASLFSIIPDASDEIIELVNSSVALIQSIPNDKKTEADLFRLAMYQTALMILTTKALDSDGDGSIGLEELQSMSEEQALAIITSIVNAEDSAAAFSGSGNQGAAAGQISGISEKINQQEGSTPAEKLKSFLAKR